MVYVKYVKYLEHNITTLTNNKSLEQDRAATACLFFEGTVCMNLCSNVFNFLCQNTLKSKGI